LAYERTKAIGPIVCLALLIVAITTFLGIGQEALAIRGQTLSITVGSPGVLSGNIKVPIHSITHVFKPPIGIQGKGTQDLVQVPINIPINTCGNTVSSLTGIRNTCNNSK
jgi:small secreted domain DUF320